MAQPTTSILLNKTTPAPPTGQQDIVFQTDGATPQQSISAYDPVMVGDSGSGGKAGNVPTPAAGDAAAGKFLKADGTFAVPGGASPLTTKGDLFGHSTVDARIPVGSDGQVLTADSTQALGVKYATPAATGITALTGDVTASGPGSAPALLASTAVAPGSYTNTNLTVDAKGRLTAASNGSAAAGSGIIQLLQKASGTASATGTATVTFSNAMQAGSALIIEYLGVLNTGAISDSQGNTYTPFNNQSFSGLAFATQFVVINIVAGSAITITMTGTGSLGWLQAYEYANVDSVDASISSSAGTVTTLSSGSVTAKFPSDLVHMTGLCNTTSVLTNSNSWPTIQAVSAGPGSWSLASFNSTIAAPGSVSNTLNSTASSRLYIALLLLKPRPVLPPGIPSLTTFGTSGAATLIGNILNIPTPATAAGSVPSAISTSPDWPPASPGSFDDEFTGGALSGSWSWINQGSATATVSKSFLTLFLPAASGDNQRGIYQTLPAPTWQAQAKLSVIGILANFINCGLALSDGTKVMIFGFSSFTGGSNGLSVTTQATVTSSFTQVAFVSLPMNGPIYLQVQDDGTNLTFWFSFTGATGSWFQFYKPSRTAFFSSGPTKIGFSGESNNASNPAYVSADWIRRTI